MQAMTLSSAAFETLAHVRRCLADAVPQRDAFTGEARPICFAAQAARSQAGVQELVAAGVLAPHPGRNMWGFYVAGPNFTAT